MKRIILALIVALALSFVYMKTTSAESLEGINPDTASCLGMSAAECKARTMKVFIIGLSIAVVIIASAIAVRKHDDKLYFQATPARVSGRQAIALQPLNIRVFRWLKDEGIEYTLLYAYLPFYYLGVFRDHLCKKVMITFLHKQKL